MYSYECFLNATARNVASHFPAKGTGLGLYARCAASHSGICVPPPCCRSLWNTGMHTRTYMSLGKRSQVFEASRAALKHTH